MTRLEPCYVPLGDGRFRSTTSTAGPWSPDSQHGGPPSALLGRAIELCSPRPETVVARMTVELLGAVPVAEVEVRAGVVRPGRSVELLEAELLAGGRVAARARAWRVRRAAGDGVPPRASAPAPLPAEERDPSGDGWSDGYLQAVEWRVASGDFVAPGPAVAWTRLRVPLVDGEELTPLQRVLAVADSGSGVSGELDIREWLFINPELTVHLHREAVGEWICLDATTTVTPGGAGLATTLLSDEQGPLGRGAQSLLVTPR